MMNAEILIVDDNTDIRNIINELVQDAGYKTRIAANYNQALAEIDKKLPDVALLDVKLDKGDNDGIELLSHIKTKNKDIPVIIISGHANIEMAIKALHYGAFEFIEKPFDQERLLNFISRAVENFNLKTQNKEYENKLFSSYQLIGDSKNTISILDQIKKISLTESRVFISRRIFMYFSCNQFFSRSRRTLNKYSALSYRNFFNLIFYINCVFAISN